MGRKWIHIVLLALLFVLVLYLYGHPAVPVRSSAWTAPPEATMDDGRAYWERLRPVPPTSAFKGDAFQFLSDVNDDPASPVVMRLDDDFPNGRSPFHDAIAELDDDLQLMWVRVPRGAGDTAVLTFDSGGVPGVSFFSSNWLDSAAAITAGWTFADSPFWDGPARCVPVWIRASAGDGKGFSFICTVRCTDGGAVVGEAQQAFKVVGALGDPDFFAGVTDYLAEGDGGPLPRYFTCEVRAASGVTPGTFEVLRFAALPRARTKMTVHETYFARKRLGGLDNSIFDVATRFPEAAFIVNGNYFRNATNKENHGDSCLGVVLVDHEVTPASQWHGWPAAHRENMLTGSPSWTYPVYALVQDDEGCGHIRLVEESAAPRQLFVPTEADGTLPYMALGGIHTLHQFVNNVGANKSHFWMTDDLVCFAMSDPQRSDSTTGEAALRELLRASGLVIEEGDINHGVAPGHSDLMYLDGGTSICMALNTGEGFEIPIAASRNVASNNTTRVNNYLVFFVDGCS